MNKMEVRVAGQKDNQECGMDDIRHDMNKMEVRGSRAEGRPRMRWMDNIRHDMNKNEKDGQHQA